MKKDKENTSAPDNINDYKYLLKLFNLVNEYLSGVKENEENLSEIIVAFCIVSEKIFKIALYKVNPILVFNGSKLKDENELISIIKNQEKNIETIKMVDAANRYKAIFENKLTNDEAQVLVDIYNIRNGLIHGYKSDSKILLDSDDIIKKMGTVWEKISAEVVLVFGADKIRTSKPRKKYTEEELENILLEEVRKKINEPTNHYNGSLFSLDDQSLNILTSRSQYLDVAKNVTAQFSPSYGSVLLERCPRCGNYSFSGEGSRADIITAFNLTKKIVSLYKCSICNLELTEKEYEIAKKIKKSSIIKPFLV
jgi:hypothetical protein